MLRIIFLKRKLNEEKDKEETIMVIEEMIEEMIEEIMIEDNLEKIEDLEEKIEDLEKIERIDLLVKIGLTEDLVRTDHPEKIENRENLVKTDLRDKIEIIDKKGLEKIDPQGKTDRPEKIDHPEKTDQIDHPEKTTGHKGTTEAPDKIKAHGKIEDLLEDKTKEVIESLPLIGLKSLLLSLEMRNLTFSQRLFPFK
jgi:hypothetical protein